VAGLFLKAFENVKRQKSTDEGGSVAGSTPSEASQRRKKRMSSLRDAANAIRMAQKATRHTSSRGTGVRKSASSRSGHIASIVSTIQATQAGKRRTWQYYAGKFFRRVWRTVRGTVIGLRDQNAVSEFMETLNAIK